MIPVSATPPVESPEFAVQTSRTYRLDQERGRAAGFVDGLEAVRQAAGKALQTERFEFFIYSFDYGTELSRLIRSPRQIRPELERVVREALLQDDRISDVTDFAITVTGDSALATFTIVSDFGTLNMEVTTNV